MPTWKKIDGYDNYSVSDDGRIRNDKSGRIKATSHESKGRLYRQVGLYSNGIGKTHSIHRLVAKAFIPNPNNMVEVNHKDGNPENNNADNLEWCTHKENIEHGWRTGLYKPIKGRPSPLKGRPNPNAGLPRVKVMCVETGIVYDSIAIAQRETGANHIYDVVTGVQQTSNGLHFVRVE